MKIPVKYLILVVALAMPAELFSQSYILKAGLNLSNRHITQFDNYELSDSYNLNSGFHGGAIGEFPLNNFLLYEIGFLLSAKGCKINREFTHHGNDIKIDRVTNLLYLDIPFNGKALLDLGDTKVYGVFGIYLGIGLSGNITNIQTTNDQIYKHEFDIMWGSDDMINGLKRFDLGWNLGAVVEINFFQIGFNYGLGFANILPNNDEGVKANNRVIGISLGYRFEGK